MQNARVDEVKKEIEDIIGIPAMDAPCISAKTGLNVEEVLERIVTDLPAPKGDENAKTKCLIFDSYYDNYKGAVAYVRVMDGTVKVGEKGQIVIPKEARQIFDIKAGDTLLVLGDEEQGLAIVKADIMKELAVKILKGLGNLSKGINDEE